MSNDSQLEEAGGLDLSSFLGARVKIKLKSSLSDPVAGKVEAATRSGLILKYKGSSKAALFELDEIESIEFDSDLAPVKPVDLQWPSKSNTRKHLATHHGFLLSFVNKISNEQAALMHKEIHLGETAHDLGHYHPGLKPPSPKEEGE